jgi:hypothetical protein
VSNFKQFPPRKYGENSAAILTSAILVILTLPATLFYFGLTSSLALGTVIVGCGLIALSMLRPVNNQSKVLFGRLSVGASIATLTLFIIVHLAVASLLGRTDLQRAIASLVSLVVIFLAASGVSRIMFQMPNLELDKSIRQAFVCMCAVAAIAAVGFTVPGANATSKAVFPFAEPSHFALSFIPLLIYSCVTGRMWSRSAALVAGLACALLLKNLTLLLGCLLVIIIVLRLKTVLALGLVSLLIIGFLDISYYQDRLDFFGDTENLSTLVYTQGWQLMSESWAKSSGWGLGFQQLGIAESKTSAAALIFLVAGNDLNLKDGSFTLSKIVSEFGVFGILVSMVFLVFAVRAFQYLRKIALVSTRDSVLVTLLQCFIIGYLVDLMVRGSGYFTPTTLAMLSSIILIHRIKRFKVNFSRDDDLACLKHNI